MGTLFSVVHPASFGDSALYIVQKSVCVFSLFYTVSLKGEAEYYQIVSS